MRLSTAELTEIFKGLIAQYGIEIVINAPGGGFARSFANATVALDVEHNESGEFVGCGLYTGDGPVYYYSDLISLNCVPFHTLHIIAHNGVTDIDVLNSWGINVKYEQLVWDVYLMGHIIDSSLKSFGLKDMAKREIGIEYPSYDDIVGKRGLKAERVTLDKQPIELVSMYNALDCWTTWKLYEKQRKAVKDALL